MHRRRHPAEDPERKRWQDPEEILGMIGLQEGEVFVDVGCGEGFFAIPAAKRVGPRGRVYAFDTNPEAVSRLGENARKYGLDNIFASIGEAERFVPCEACADVVFFGNDLHDLADPIAALRNARIMLRASGRLVDLDWKAVATGIGPPPEMRFSEEKASGMMEKAGFRILSVRAAGPYHYLILAERAEPG